MKVAIIGTRGYPYVYGGFETFAKELSERLVEKDIEVRIYCQKNLFKEMPDEVNGIKLIYIPTIQKKSLNQLIHSFLSIIHATFSQADVILVVNLAAGPMGWIPKITGKKTLINVDGLEWLRPKWKGLGAAYFRFAAKIATKIFDQIITDAEAMRAIYLKEFNVDSKVIAYGAPSYKKADITYLKRFNLELQEYYLIVGRLIPDNNADLIIKGFLESDSIKKLIIVGDVPYRDKYAEELKALANERLEFVGYVTDSHELMALYQNCFAYIHGHQFGGTNPAMLKAMSNNCAILALDTVFNREMLNNGELGLFFELNAQSLTRLLKEVEKDSMLPAKLRKSVAGGLTEKYDWDFVTSEYEIVMRRLCQKENKDNFI